VLADRCRRELPWIRPALALTRQRLSLNPLLAYARVETNTRDRRKRGVARAVATASGRGLGPAELRLFVEPGHGDDAGIAAGLLVHALELGKCAIGEMWGIDSDCRGVLGRQALDHAF
jgi:hypothetical protein